MELICFQKIIPSIWSEFDLQPFEYNLVIARLEPENNVETIIQAHLAIDSPKLCIIGNFSTKHGAISVSKNTMRKYIFLEQYTMMKN